MRGDEEKVEALRAKGILSELSGAECDKVIDSALSKIAEQAALTFVDCRRADPGGCAGQVWGGLSRGICADPQGFLFPSISLGRDHGSR